jgi:hypothetical protein
MRESADNDLDSSLRTAARFMLQWGVEKEL